MKHLVTFFAALLPIFLPIAFAQPTATSSAVGITANSSTNALVAPTAANFYSANHVPLGTAGSLTGILGVANGGTGISSFGTGIATFLGTPSSANLAAALTDETGTGAAVFATSPTLVTPILGTPTSVTLTNATGLPISTGVSGLGTGIATALGVNVGSAGAPVIFNGALGIPSSGTLTNATGLPVSSGISGLGTGVATALAVATNSAGGFSPIDGTATLTNKTISGASNTLTNIANGSLTNSAITIAGTSTSLGGSITLDTIDGLASAGIVARTAANTRAARTITGTANQVTVANGDGVSGNPTLSLPTTLTSINSITSASSTDLTLTGNGGASITLANGAAGNVTLAPSTSGIVKVTQPNSTSFGLSSRTQITTFPAVAVRSQVATTVTAFDVMPNGSPTESATNGWSWLDVCGQDCLTTNGTIDTARVGFTSSGAEFGSRHYVSGSLSTPLNPVVFTMNGTEYASILATGSFRVNGSGGVLLDYGNIQGSFAGVWGNQTSPTVQNYMIGSGSGDTLVNAPSSQSVRIRINNSNIVSTSSTVMAVSPNTASTSTTTGALTVVGGVGVQGKTYLGDNLTIKNGAWIHFSQDSSTSSILGFYASNDSTLYGLLGISAGGGSLSASASASDTVLRAQNSLRFCAGSTNTDRLLLDTSGNFTVLNSTSSTSTTTGSLINNGGLGNAGALWVGGLANIAGVLTAANTTEATNSTTAGTVVSGGLGVAKKIITASTLTTAAGVTWDMGAASATTITSPNKSLKVTVAGTDYYIPAKLTND